MKPSIIQKTLFHAAFILISAVSSGQTLSRSTSNFGNGWKFYLGDLQNAHTAGFDDNSWRFLNLPHDWSIEGEFSKTHPATAGGGALPGGIGWYRKTFTLNEMQKTKQFFIDFDGIYCNSEVWINGNYLGNRPNGYISFRYDLTPYLNFGPKKNILAVKVDNSKQPNARWYTGSGIYRNVWLVETGHVYVDKWGTFITTPVITEHSAKVDIKTTIRNTQSNSNLVTLVTTVYDAFLKEISKSVSQFQVAPAGSYVASQEIIVSDPKLWSVTTPYLYKAVTHVECDGKICDNYETNFGIRSFEFHSEKGFSLNGNPLKILGVCNHHDLGCLGSVVNTRALERQLEILKSMGCNGIRTSHNPPAPELLELCDRMGFIVMNEAFDMWKKKKSKYDYSLYWDEWHTRDLEDFILRDRNHPSVFIWSIGNEILEQWDSTGTTIAKELTSVVKNLDPTRPVTVGCNDPKPHNYILRSGVIDLIGYNYHHQNFLNFHHDFPGQKFIATETTSALATRGEYDMPSDSVRRWPLSWDKPFTTGNPDLTCSAYDNCSTPWGSTHEETWKVMKKQNYLSGMFVWTGFDYLGEPTPYSWPARSSYFGIIDLAGFPKDAFYMYQSEWTKTPVLHIFPHWNWMPGDTVDIWAYFNSAEVELFLNEKSLGTKAKKGDELHVSWRLAFEPGTLRAISKTNGREILRKEIRTAGKPAGIRIEPDRSTITANGKDLSFIKVWVVDAGGNIVPDADNLIEFSVDGEGTLVGVDNGNPVSHESFKAKSRKAMNGLCLAVIQSASRSGNIKFTARSAGLQYAETVIRTR